MDNQKPINKKLVIIKNINYKNNKTIKILNIVNAKDKGNITFQPININ
jgi:hypothetical protein